ncbi:MAG: hypothetical protein ABII06_21985 [Pseudomonadota bacterium]
MPLKKIWEAAGMCLFFLSVFVVTADASVVTTARFTAEKGASGATLRGVDGVKIERTEGRAFAEFRVGGESEGTLWIRVFFPWYDKSSARVSLDERYHLTVGAMGGKDLWNSGNIDIWHWIPVFRGRLQPGKHRVTVDGSAGIGAAVESILWSDSERSWEEEELAGEKVRKALKGIESISLYAAPGPAGKSLVIEGEKGVSSQGRGDNSTVRLDADHDFLFLPIRLERPFKGSVWFRIFQEWKNNYEGWTLDELANTAYFFIDGELKKTVWGEDGFHWRWYRADDITLDPGVHLLLFKKRGAPASIDKFVLYSGSDFRRESWFRVGPGVEPEYDPYFQNGGYPGSQGPMKIVSRLPTGFGVPGSGYPRFLNDQLLLLPGGEGTVTAVDVSDPRRPKIHNYGLNWYFNEALFPFREGFYLNSIYRGVYYVEGIIDKEGPTRFRIVDMDCGKYGRIGALFPKAKPFPIAVTQGGSDGAAVMDMSRPLYPRIVGKIKNFHGRGFLLSQDGNSGAAIDQDGDLGLIDFSDPEKPVCRTLLKAPAGEGSGGAPKSELIGLSGEYIFLRRASKIQVYRNSGGLNAESIGVIDLGKGAGSFVRAYEYKGLIHVLDGGRGPGQYSMHDESPHSRWDVFDPSDLSRPVFTYTDPHQTAYAYTTFRSGKAYVFDYNYGLWIFDLKDPKRPRKAGGISTAAEGHYLHILDNDILCMSQTFGGTLKIIDVKNPLEPIEIGEFWDGIWFAYDTAAHTDLMTGKGTVLFLPKPGRGLQMIDFERPDKPRVLGYIRGRKCRIIRNRLYTIDGTSLLLYDVTDERNPRLLSELNTGLHNLSMALDHPRTLWVTDLTNIRAVDVSNPETPILIGQWENREEKQFWGGIFYYKGVIFGSMGKESRTHEIATIDATDPSNMTLISIRNWQPQGLHSELNDFWANFYRGDFLLHDKTLIASNYGRVEVYDVSDPLRPESVQMLNTGFQWTAGRIKNGYLFVPTLSGLVVVKQ